MNGLKGFKSASGCLKGTVLNAPQILRPDNGRGKAIPVHCLGPDRLPAVLQKLEPAQRHMAEASGFKAQAGTHVLLAGEKGLEAVLFGLGEKNAPERTPFLPGKLASLLPAGTYRLLGADDARLAALAFALETYRFTRYRKGPEKTFPALLFGGKNECAALQQQAEAIFLTRDLINTPANDLGPDELADAVKQSAKRFGGQINIVKGPALERGFPLIHAVGKGSSRAPLLIDLVWGKASHPKITLVGKGVVFDTGGLDIKPSSNMLLMKKDMGGAANALALAQMIMAARLKVRLRLLIPAVENSISGTSFRPSDVLQSRSGQTVEIGNTDAEGRLVLADALTLAGEENPDLLIDMATLTGAARVALGPELPAFFTNDAALAREVEKAAAGENDPLWRLPLYQRYRPWLKSKIADLNNISTNGFAGAIVAALFLQHFVTVKSWMHFDMFAWSNGAPGRPEGGEAQAVRALLAFLTRRYGQSRA